MARPHPAAASTGVSLLAADPEIHDVLGSIPNETAVNVRIGHAAAESDTQDLAADTGRTSWFY
jgi:hypothetical protein